MRFDVRRRMLFAGLGAAALLGSAGTASAQNSVTIAVYAGVATDEWKKAIAEPYQAETGVPTHIFDPTIPAAAVAAAGGQPQFQAALVAGYSIAPLAASDKLEAIDPNDIPNLKLVPEKLLPHSPSGKLYGIPVYFSFFGIAYNTDLAKKEDFKSWKSLVDPKWKGKISIGTPPFMAAYDVTLFSYLNGGTEKDITPGIPMLKQVAANVGSVYTTMAILEAQLSRGEVVFAPFYANQVLLERRAGAKNIDIVRPDEGGLILPYYLVIPKGAKNLPETRKLLNAILTPPYQERLSEGGNWPVNPQTKLPPELVRELGSSLDDALNKNFAPDWYFVGMKQAERAHQIEEIMDSVK